MPVLPLTDRPAAVALPHVAPEAAPPHGPLALELSAGSDPAALAGLLERTVAIRILFAGFADGRGFSLARRLRDLGFAGRLRAVGALIPDQRGALRACGFDEIELTAERLARQGPDAWSAEAAAPPFRHRTRRIA